jgi:hypothetical protein
MNELKVIRNIAFQPSSFPDKKDIFRAILTCFLAQIEPWVGLSAGPLGRERPGWRHLDGDLVSLVIHRVFSLFGDNDSQIIDGDRVMLAQIRWLMAALLLAAMPAAQAFYPASGFYWNPQLPGRGYGVEVQDNVVFITVYAYDQLRIPFWYTAQGELQGDSLFRGQLDVADGGTCVGCSFSQPSVVAGGGGPFELQFIDAERARLTWDGGVENLERFNFAFGDAHERMLGEWTLMLDFSSERADEFPFDGDVLVFDLITGSGADETFEGCRPDDSQSGFCSSFALDNHDAAGLYDPLAGEYVIVVADSPGFFLAYFLDIGLNRLDGVAQVYRTDANPGGPEYPVRGFRSASRSFVDTGVGPAKSGAGSASGLISRRPQLAGTGNADPHRQLLVARLIDGLNQ